MTNKVCRSFSAFLVAALVTLGISNPTPVSAATDVYTTPVGFVKTSITNTLSGNTFTPIGLPLQRMKADQGLLSAVTSNTITDGTKNWSSNNWWDPTTLHYVQFLTGSAVGRYYSVATNTANVLSLNVGSENLQTLGVVAGDRYEIRPFWRIRDAFGDVTNTTLQAASTANGADNILIFDEATQGYKTVFPRLTATQTNWFMIGTGIVDNFPLLPDEGILVQRKTGSLTNLVLVGEVATTNFVTVLQQGFNLVGNAFPAGVAISNSQLIAVGTGFQGGSTANGADAIFTWDGAGWKQVFYRTVVSGTNWFMVGSGITNSLVLDVGQGYLIQNKVSGGLWTRSLPYTP